MISGQTAVLGPSGQLVQPSQKLKSNSASENCSDKEINNVPENELMCSICMLSLFLSAFLLILILAYLYIYNRKGRNFTL